MGKVTIYLPAFGLLVWAAATVAQRPVGTGKQLFSSEVTITVEGEQRIIRCNGIPNHPTGQFPNDGNPNSMSPQRYEFRMPVHPKPADHLTRLRMQPFGVAVNGVVFDPGAAEWWDGDPSSGWQYEPIAPDGPKLGIDQSNAHVQPGGAYHYHGIPNALVYALTGGEDKMVIVGWAADGFPIYNPIGHSKPDDAGSPLKKLKSSYVLKKGTRPNGPGGAYNGTFVEDYEYAAGSGDLDECNGLTGVTPEYPQGIYHYVLTAQFPFVPRLYRGVPDPSFNVHGGPGGPGGGPRGRGGPGSGGRPPLPQVVTAIDTNGDGIISADEIANASAALRTLDKNGDGQLTRDEYGSPRQNGRGRGAGDNAAGGGAGQRAQGAGGPGAGGPGGGQRPPLPLIIRALDADGDGIISAEEIANAPAALRKLDKNGDGQLTIDEYMGPPPRGRGGQGGNRGDNGGLPDGYPKRQ